MVRHGQNQMGQIKVNWELKWKSNVYGGRAVNKREGDQQTKEANANAINQSCERDWRRTLKLAKTTKHLYTERNKASIL